MSYYKGNAKKLDDLDLPRIGATIGVGEDVLHALIEVETTGSGFDDQGRVKMLFEPHRFFANLHGAARATALRQGLAYPHWGEQLYPRDSYPRLEKALAIDEIAALKSASWGLGQIMGENYLAAGYPTVKEMVVAFADDEAEQLAAMISFIKANFIDDDLRRIEALTKAGKAVTSADWVPVVRVYNGPSYAKNNYHVRVSAAYNKWLRRPARAVAPPVPDIRAMAMVEEVHAHAEPIDDQIDGPVDDGTRLSEPASGAVTAAGAKEVKIAQMSPQTKAISFTMIGTAVLGFVKEMWSESQSSVVSAGQYAAAHIPIVLVILALAALGIYLYNQSARRAAARTAQIVEITANPAKNDVLIT